MPFYLQFEQVDVFAERPHEGNALAVVVGADELTAEQMQAFARWTQLSETTFLLRPEAPEAHYRVRIFTPLRELPFAGHPTLGSCEVWLKQQGNRENVEIIQECSAGLIRVLKQGRYLAFSAPPLLRSGPLDAKTLNQIEQGLGLAAGQILASQWVDNGPGWAGVLLAGRDQVLAIKPDYAALQGLNVGVIAPWAGPEAEADVEVRTFMGEECNEDPVTGSLNAGLAQWLIGAGILRDRYTVSQGTVMGRRGRLQIECINGTIWVGGEVQHCISGRAVFC
ncbi:MULTISPECIES: PhzF family phenazine biosynthesis protein [Pseudomonas]|jgi:PhzF family phenazine biosynthesis protein|uniref:Phenazine biosynthesis protein PhzF family n=1 Tax=Pseudomonas putida (strain W619) TaxID=390235 RepID=B1J6W2_PSEPW|nr:MULTISPECIES: PhzF family phenazine biosynthesis protein [Pseudomonas]MDH1571810.1 PhzF family phenazine biosynthesis protein [Pseudomonas sp. GD03746]QQE85999.1 PhzF family phenazine biosynthesis protein [Pseudomonas putida]UTL83002.1 PhzF family phenazine biosynthesis protein [Pseudomonas putida]